MRKGIIMCLLFVGACCFVGYSLASEPLGVSPGDGAGEAVVGTSFPTFSWAAVEGSVGYRLEIFKSLEEVLHHDEALERSEPVLRVDIPAPALSWSPSGKDALQSGERYIWYVKAIDSNGEGQWSSANRFRIEASIALSGMDEAVREKVREYVRTDTEIREAIREIGEEFSKQTTSETIAMNTSESPEEGRLKGTEGDSNTFYGMDAGASITSGISNTFVGKSAGQATTTGNENVFMGRYVGFRNTSGGSNVFLGSSAGYSNTTGNSNTFIGRYAGYDNTGGIDNVFIGSWTGFRSTTGNSNTFVGRSAGYTNTEGSRNTFLGNEAGYWNTIGEYNTFVGRASGYNNTEGHSNTTVGVLSGYKTTTGYHNTFVGRSAGYKNTTGYDNTYLGRYAGYDNSTGSGNIFIGARAGYNEAGSNKLYIHNSDSSDPLIYGDFENRELKINGSLNIADVSSPSDGSLKKDVQPLDNALGKVTSLNGVSFNWRRDENPDKGFSNNRQIGLIAQDVEKVLPELVRTGKDGKKSLAYDKLTAVLVEAIKAQQVRMENQEAEIASQRSQIEELKAMVREMASKKL